MQAKTFEIRDRHTFIPVLAVRLDPGCEADRFLLGRAGFTPDPARQAKYIQLVQINGGFGRTSCDPYDWGCKTMAPAHQHIIDHFDDLESGAVVDSEFLRGESKMPKLSEAAP